MGNKEKSQAELQIEALSDVFGIAADGFEEFFKKAQSANGNYSKSATNGDGSQSATSGDGSQSATNGNYSKSAANGWRSQSAANGNYSKSAANGNYSQSAANGDGSQSAANGNYSQSAANGDGSKSAANGWRSQSAANGDGSKSAANGDGSKSAANGWRSKSSCSGENSAASALGYRAAVSGDIGSLLMASEYKKDGNNYIPIGGKADLVDGKNLKPNCWYIVEGGEWVEVDFTDNLFTYVISTRNGVKKVKDENGKILYLVTDGSGKFAHGKTIKDARESLVYKLSNRDTSAYKDLTLDSKITFAEAVSMYRAITGACEGGVRSFVESNSDKKKAKYTIKELIGLTKGEYGNEQFAKFFEANNG